MDRKRALIKSISVDKESIHFYGQYPFKNKGRAYQILVFENEPYEKRNIYSCPVHTELLSSERDLSSREFHITIDRYLEGKDRIYSKFAVVIREDKDSENQFLDGPSYVTDMKDISTFNYPFPTAKTIKGLQVNMVSDAVSLGIGHAALNLNLPSILLPEENADAITYVMDGEKFYFNNQYLKNFDKKVKDLSDHSIVVTLILLNSISWDNTHIYPELNEVLIHPDYDKEGFISAFNIVSQQGLKYYKAFMEFVVERYTHPDEKFGKACGFIIGNEVDSQWIWCNAGEKTVSEYMMEYGIALRTACYAAKKKYSEARIYISLDHYWTLCHQESSSRYYRGKDIIDILNSYSKEEGDYDWGVAYHPYPEDLSHPDFWNDKTAVESFYTGRITFKNIEVLPRYLSQKEYQYKGHLRHIILSEQGFHSEETEESEKIQAAAYCLAYHKIESTKGIEAFILHAHVDNKDEFGLNLGLWRRDKESNEPNAPGSPKPIYYIFRDIDSSNRDNVYKFAKEVIGEEYWL